VRGHKGGGKEVGMTNQGVMADKITYLWLGSVCIGTPVPRSEYSSWPCLTLVMLLLLRTIWGFI